MISGILPGRYIVAVSGGVDSVVLLDLLSKQKTLELIVAHFDHGIREDSYKDCDFVEQLAEKYDLDFVGAGAELGKDTSEEHAREARYKFLRQICKNEQAKAIILAHHADDVLETVIFNLLRGTGRKGATSLNSGYQLIRPLLSRTKKEIIKYAVANNLQWREDSTNKDTNYSRNWIRLKLVPKLSTHQKEQLMDLHKKHQPINQEIDNLLSGLIETSTKKLDLSKLRAMPYDIASETTAFWLRQNGIRQFDKKTIHRIVHAAKTIKPGKTIAVYGRTRINITKTHIVLEKTSE